MITITGDKKIKAKLRTFSQRAKRKVAARALRKVGRPIMDTAKYLVPKDTGILEGSINLEPLSDRSSVGVRVTAEADHAAYQEFGTKNMEANPFLLPALIEQQGGVKKGFASEMRRVVREEDGR